jgi:hypothetical protein
MRDRPVVMEIPACMQKLNQEFLSRKRGIIMQKSKSELWDLIVPIMLYNHSEQVCEVSIHSLWQLWRFSCMQKLNQEFLSQKRGIIMQKSKSELWNLCHSC